MEYAAVFGNALVIYAPNLVGFALPLLIEVFNKDIQNEKIRFLMEVIVCFAFASVLDWNQIALGDPGKALLTATILFTESETLFSLYFKTSWIRSKIQNPTQPVSGVDTTATE